MRPHADRAGRRTGPWPTDRFGDFWFEGWMFSGAYDLAIAAEGFLPKALRRHRHAERRESGRYLVGSAKEARNRR